MQGLIGQLTSAGAKRSQRLDKNSITELENILGLVFTKEAKESHLLVATLIATVSFAAGITLSGSNFQDAELKVPQFWGKEPLSKHSLYQTL